MSPIRRDAEGRREVGPTWESIVERQIREAIEAGKFDDLPHRGRRMPLEDDSAAGEWAMAFRMLKNAGAAPPWIESDREVRRLLARRDAILERAPRASVNGRRRDREELERLVSDVNREIAHLNVEAPTDRQRRAPLDPAAELARLAAAHEGR
ncbi:MAG: DUF1992 domain-containing protein [Chloroflexota bacterium]|jgi:hypothetical protein